MKQKFDILFLCQFFYPEYVSSATLPFDTAEAFTRSGYSVGVLCGYPKEYSDAKKVPKKQKYKGIFINRIRYAQMGRVSFFGRVINYLSFLSAVMLHLPMLRKYKYVLVYSNPPMLPLIAVLAKKLFKIKVIFVSYDVYPEIGIRSGKIKEGSLADRGFRRINRSIFNSADQVVALSEDMKSYLSQTRNIAEDKIAVIANWAENIPLKMKNEVKTSLFFCIPKTAFVVSYLGNLGTCQEEKALLETMSLLRHNTNIHFLIAGHGNKMPLLKETAEKRGLKQAHFFDFLKGEDYKDALALSDVFIVTLIDGMKGLCSPSKTSSYLMAGRPVIAEAEAGVELAEDILNSRCGYRVEPKDFEAMEKCILEQYENRSLNSEMGKNSVCLYKNKYEKTVCLFQYIKLMKRMEKDV